MTEHIQSQIQSLTDTASENAVTVTSGIASTLEGWGAQAMEWVQGILDRFITPEQRATILAKLQEFMLANPKLSTFLGMNIALTGVPLGLFILFSLTIATFSLLVGIGGGIIAAVLFTITCVGIALSFVFPIIFFTTMVACFLFLWGLGGYHLIKWINGGDEESAKEGQPLLESGSIGDSLNALTGGRLTGFIHEAKAEKAKDDITGFSDEYNKPQPPPETKKPAQQTPASGKKSSQQNGATQPQVAASEKKGAQQNTSPQQQQPKQQLQSTAGQAVASPASNVQKATKATGIENKVRTATSATGVVKGGLSGATSLG